MFTVSQCFGFVLTGSDWGLWQTHYDGLMLWFVCNFTTVILPLFLHLHQHPPVGSDVLMGERFNIITLYSLLCWCMLAGSAIINSVHTLYIHDKSIPHELTELKLNITYYCNTEIESTKKYEYI